MDANSRRKRDPSNKSPVPPLSDSPFLSTASARNPYLSTCSSPCPTLRIPLAARNRTESLPSTSSTAGLRSTGASLTTRSSISCSLFPLDSPLCLSLPLVGRPRDFDREKKNGTHPRSFEKNRRKRLSPFRQFSFLCSRFEQRGEKEAKRERLFLIRALRTYSFSGNAVRSWIMRERRGRGVLLVGKGVSNVSRLDDQPWKKRKN